MMKLLPAGLLLGLGYAAEIKLVTFDGATGTTFKFAELNDPVMGGKSSGTWNLGSGFGIMDGQVLDVPSLKAPGFIKAAADGKFNDASSVVFGDLVLSVRTTTPEYKGFRVSIAAGTLSPSYSCAGGGSIPFSRGCYKAQFAVPNGTDFSEVRIPFNVFSDLWSPATGAQTKTCAQEPGACITSKALAGIKRIEVWAEGVDGKAHIEVQSITASTASSSSFVSSVVLAESENIRPPTEYDTCNAAVQANLRFGVSGRVQPTVPVDVSPNETLAEAVCCDRRAMPFAEPQFLYQAPDINLYAKLDATGVTTFYDSVCGLPLFRTPVNRTLADFKADTDEHGWPSFRTPEVFMENVVTDKETTFVTSKCGTHLGSYLPDDQGPRWCIDLACVSGNKQGA